MAGTGGALVLLNPRVTASAVEADKAAKRYEECLSFFDVRGLVPRPLRITSKSPRSTAPR
ncbi:peptide deformylase [Streptomyces sp. NBC_00728]|uniref:peptide deformylase n=1 Tax=Streptomyces sp. NBC_00728 TaxID=2903676 RepID=UPI003869D2D8